MGYIVRDSLYLLGIPLLQLTFDVIILSLRLDDQVRLCTLAVQADDEWKDRLIEWTALKEMVVAYRQSMTMGCKFEDVHKDANARYFALLQYQTATQTILKYFHSIFIVAAYVWGGHKVLDGSYKVSSFVLLMSTVHKFDQTISTICSNAFSIINGAAPINKIASVLNATTRRKALLCAEQRRHRILATLDDPDFDPRNISLIDVAFDRGESYYMEDMIMQGIADGVYSGERMDIVGPLSFAIPQGTVNAITGPVDAPQKLKGKKTLLMLLGRFILPTNGIVVYPPNLRVRYIPGEPPDTGLRHG